MATTTPALASNTYKRQIRNMTNGSNIFAVGSDGDYLSMQAALDAIKVLPQFSEVLGTGTISINLRDKTVVGVGTSFLTNFAIDGVEPTERYISLETAGGRRWIGVDQVISDTVLVLDQTYRGSNLSGANYYIGTPIMRVLEVLDDIPYQDLAAGVLFLNATGVFGGGQLDAIALEVVFRANFGVRIEFHVKSGILILTNLHSQPNDSPRFSGDSGTDTCENLTVKLINPNIHSSAGGILRGPFGNVTLQGGDLNGQHNNILACAYSHLNILNMIFKSRSRGTETANTNLVQQPILGVGGVMKSSGNQYGYDASGNSASPYMMDLFPAITVIDGDTEALNGSYYFINDVFTIEVPEGGTEVPGFVMFALRDVGDGDVYFINCDFNFSKWGEPVVPPASWTFLAWKGAGGVAMPDTRIHIINSKLPDMASSHTGGDAHGQRWDVVELVGDMGVKALTDAATIDNDELSCLRGSTFTLTVTQATTIPAPYLTGPIGTKWKFILTQDAVVDNITWDAAFVFHTAWADASAANQRCIIEFTSDGNGNLLQDGEAENKWF